MSNLRNPEIRARDIRKLVSYKSQCLVWDAGCDETSEWVLASIEDDMHTKRLIDWLLSKNINTDNEALLIKSDWKAPTKIKWGDFAANPESFFGNDMFYLYDIDLNWQLEYQVQEIVRFGIYDTKVRA